MDNRLLDTKTVADTLCMSYGHAKNLLCAGRFPIPHVRIGRNIRFKKASVDKYINQLREIKPRMLE